MIPKKTKKQIFNDEMNHLYYLMELNETPIELIWAESSDKTLKFTNKDYLMSFMEEQDENKN